MVTSAWRLICSISGEGAKEELKMAGGSCSRSRSMKILSPAMFQMWLDRTLPMVKETSDGCVGSVTASSQVAGSAAVSSREEVFSGAKGAQATARGSNARRDSSF